MLSQSKPTLISGALLFQALGLSVRYPVPGVPVCLPVVRLCHLAPLSASALDEQLLSNSTVSTSSFLGRPGARQPSDGNLESVDGNGSV